MAEHDEAHGALHALAAVPEKRAPAHFAHQRDHLRIVGDDERATLVEDGQHVASAPALAALVRNLGGVDGVDARLGARKSEPGEGIEPVVQVFRPRRNLTAAEDAQLVICAIVRRSDETHRVPAFRDHARFLGEAVQARKRALGAEPRRERLVNWMA